MPLSEHEQRLLEQIERGLYADDPRLASTVRSTNLTTHYRRRLRLAVLGLLVGVVTLLAGVIFPRVFVIGIAGFILMLLSALRGVSAIRGLTGHAPAPGAARSTPGGQRGAKGSIGSRAEERFRRRFDRDSDG